MAITFPQTPVAFQLSGVTSNTGSLASSVTAGNLLVISIAKPVTTLRTFSVTDDRSGIWTPAAQNDANSGRQAEIWYSVNHPGGATTVTVSVNSGTTSCDVCLIEVAGAAISSPVDDFDSFDNLTSTNTFYQANTTGFNTTTDSIIFAVQALNGSVTTITADGTYTLLNSATTAFGAGAFLHHYRITTTALTDHRPTVTTTGTTRQGPGACAAFVVGSSGGLFPHHMDQLTGGFQTL
jgi:hypothetical protein